MRDVCENKLLFDFLTGRREGWTGRQVIRERDKHRRLWRLAVATHPQKKSSGEQIANPAVLGCMATAGRHSLLYYSFSAVLGCGATARRHSLLCYSFSAVLGCGATARRHSLLCYSFSAVPGCGSHPFVFFFVFSDYGRVLCTNKRLYIRLSRTGSRKT